MDLVNDFGQKYCDVFDENLETNKLEYTELFNQYVRTT